MINEDLNASLRDTCATCLKFRSDFLNKKVRTAIDNAEENAENLQSYAYLQGVNNQQKKELRNTKNQLDNHLIGVHSEWEQREEKEGRSKIYGNLKNKGMRDDITLCLAVIERLMLKTNGGRVDDPDIARVLYTLKTSLGKKLNRNRLLFLFFFLFFLSTLSAFFCAIYVHVFLTLSLFL